MLRIKTLCLGTLFLGAISCTSEHDRPEQNYLATGSWLFSLDIGEASIPFNVELSQTDAVWTAVIANGEERIQVDELVLTADSFHMRMPLFDSEFHAQILSNNLLSGVWINRLKGSDYRIPFTAKSGNYQRFGSTSEVEKVAGSWNTTFGVGEDAYPAIGVFEQSKSAVSGTFLTETGDYRYLEGNISGDSLYLSTFDGSHAFLFQASIDGPDSMRGVFYSGNHWQETWTAFRDPNARLAHPDSISTLRNEAAEELPSYSDLDGIQVGPAISRKNNRALLVQIMGTWCPNCVDETRLLNELHEKYSAEGLDIVGLAYEVGDSTRGKRALERFRDRLDVTYPLVFAGSRKDSRKGLNVPYIEKIKSYPTCIFIDRKGEIKQVKTGFTGPGAGERYEPYKQVFISQVERLLHEDE